MSNRTLKRSALAMAVASGIAAMPLQAQMLEEVVVTATKRAVGMQDVPIALSVMSSEKMTEQGINNLQDMALFMPNVTIAEAPAGDSLFIRGIGSGINYGFEQSVGTFIDGVYFGRGQASRTSFLDVERVEVLKGPQSTLFGKNTIAGAINITTAKPTDEFEGSVQATYEPEFNGWDTTLTLSGPITEDFGARLVLRKEETDGFLKNTFTGEDEKQEENIAGRLVLSWQPTDDLDATFKWETGESETIGGNEVQFLTSPTAAAIYQGVDPDYSASYGYDKRAFQAGPAEGAPRRGEEYHDSKWDIGTLTLEYAMGEYTLKSITGYVDYEFQNANDSDFSPLNLIYRQRDETHEQFTQEFLITSPQGDSFEWLAGVYYQTEELEHLRNTDLTAPSIGFPAAFSTTSIGTFEQDTETFSAFFQGTVHFSDTLRLIAGIRYSEDEKEFEKTQYNADIYTTNISDSIDAAYDRVLDFTTRHTLNGTKFERCEAATITTLAPCTVDTNRSNVREEDHVTGDITIQWDATDETMLYAKYGTGYKAGGFDEDNSRGRFDDAEYEDESVETFELGSKMDLFEGRGRLNAALFYSEYEDVQVSTFDGVAGFVVGNAAASEVTGLELDGSYAITDELTLNASVAWLDANYDEYTTAACTNDQTVAHTGTGPCLQDLSGEPLQYAADVSGNLGLAYNTEITDSLELSLGADLMYTDEFNTANDADPILVQDSFTKVNLRVGLADIDGVWSVALLGKNVTDEETFIFGNDIPLGSQGFAGSYEVLMQAPRSYELQATYNF